MLAGLRIQRNEKSPEVQQKKSKKEKKKERRKEEKIRKREKKSRKKAASSSSSENSAACSSVASGGAAGSHPCAKMVAQQPVVAAATPSTAASGEELTQRAPTSVSVLPSDVKVGDGGAAWRRRAQMRAKQAEKLGAAGEELKPVKNFGKDEAEADGRRYVWGGTKGRSRAGRGDKSFVEQQIERLQVGKHQPKLPQQPASPAKQEESPRAQRSRQRSTSCSSRHRRKRRSQSSSRRRQRVRGSNSSSSSSCSSSRRVDRARGRAAGDQRGTTRRPRSRSCSRKGTVVANGAAGGWQRRPDSDDNGGDKGAKLAAEAEQEVDDVLRHMQSKYGGGSAGKVSDVGADGKASSASTAIGASEAAADETEDANTLGALAMQAMLSGDMARYEELNKRLEHKQTKMVALASVGMDTGGVGAVMSTVPGERTEVIEEVDAAGRSRKLVESLKRASVAVKGKKRGIGNVGTAKGGKDVGFYEDDDVSLEELIRREKVEGVQDYDANLADHIVRKKKFKALHEDDDEAYALGWYEGVSQKLDAKKLAEVTKRKEEHDKQQVQRNLSNCDRCMESKKFRPKDAVLSVSPRAYVCAEGFGQCILPGQVFISPQEHLPAVTDLDEATVTEMRNYQKCLVRFYESQNPPKAVIFAESAVHRVSRERILMGGGPHAAVVAYPVDLSILSEARAYFKKAFDEAESEWSAQHKKVIETSAKGGIRAAIPKNFPYVHIDFCLGGGYAHVVEEAHEFPKHFAQQTIAGMCELTVLDRAYTSKEEYWKAVREMKTTFAENFDWTAALTA
eukprot:TRINITY_DN18594_c0_g1_i1.p1 TRINITY_DN18594_c0_g1~~TRINITY_DN18594_c0_g1_i1.p1  ORF type:complete len:815 (+),score=196.42 TRINITY_DN18594_c0_g1_i1:72-2447(+)